MRLTNTFSIEEVEAAIAAILDDDPVSSGDERIRGVISDFELGGVISDLQYLVKGEDLLSEDDAEVGAVSPLPWLR